MLTIQPETVVNLVQAIDEYMAVGGVDGRQPSINACVLEAESPHPELSALAKIIEAQGLHLSKLLEKVEALEAPRPLSRPPRSVWQAGPSDGCFICGGPHWKRDCPQGRPIRPQGQPGRRAGPGGLLLPLPHMLSRHGKWRRSGPTLRQRETGPTKSGLGQGRASVRPDGTRPKPEQGSKILPADRRTDHPAPVRREGPKRQAPTVEADGWQKMPGIPSFPASAWGS